MHPPGQPVTHRLHALSNTIESKNNKGETLQKWVIFQQWTSIETAKDKIAERRCQMEEDKLPQQLQCQHSLEQIR